MTEEPLPEPNDEEDGVRVRTHPGLCAGWGNCHRWAPAVYPLDDEGHVAVHLLSVPPEHALEAWIGASVCPAAAISVIGPPEEHWVRRRQAQEDPERAGLA
jgi:ferredoxin